MLQASELAKQFPIWVLEDDSSQRFIFSEVLSYYYPLRFFERVQELQDAIDEKKDLPRLMILDIRLPDRNIVESGQFSLRCDLPFIVISSIDEIDIIRKCYEIGCVDYLIKPFQKNELLIAIENFEKQAFHVATDAVSAPMDFEILPDGITVMAKDQRKVELTIKEMKIFRLLFNRFGSEVPRQDVLSTVWGTATVSEKALDVHLFNLRKKLQGLDLRIECRGGRYHLSADSRI